MGETTEFSFILKPSTIAGAGVGVFAVEDIKRGTIMSSLFPDGFVSKERNSDELPELFKGYSIAKEGDIYATPRQFNRMEIGWYLNHSLSPNIKHDGKVYSAIRDIGVGEELFINYNDLNEPQDKRKSYYSE
jgi:uncharacterized protein